MAAQVVELLQSQLTERDSPGFSELAVSPGLYKWCQEMDVCFSDFHDLEQEEQELSLAAVQEEMELHISTLDYCLERFDELLDEERENEREERVVLERIVQQRLAASQASRV